MINVRENMIKSAEWMKGYFQGQDVFIVAGGPSLHGFDFSKLSGKKVIAINHSYRYCTPDVLVFLDSKFLKEARDLGHDPYQMPCKIIAGPSSGMKTKDNCTVIQIADRPTKTPHQMYGRSQSGLIAINFAIISGAARILLLGFDGKFINGLGHFYSKEFPHTQDGNEVQYKKMIRCYDLFKDYKNIINLNPDSAYSAFKKIPINEVLS